MRAARIREYGGPASVEVVDMPVPEPGPGHVRLRVKAAAMNNSDLQVTKGGYGRPPLPRTLGQEGAGIVDAVGEGVTSLKAGDRVAGRIAEAWAEYALALESDLLPLPEGLTFEAAASLPIAYITAIVAMVSTGRVQAGDWVLISPASGGVGTAAICLAKLLGARVIATTSSADKVDGLRQLGADHVFDYSQDDVVAEVLKLTGGVGVPVALDGGGAVTFAHCMGAIASGGRIVIYGYVTGTNADLPVHRLIVKNASVSGIAIWTNPAYRDAVAMFRDVVLPAVAAKQLSVVVDDVLPLERAAEGLARIEGRQVAGKVVVAP